VRLLEISHPTSSCLPSSDFSENLVNQCLTPTHDILLSMFRLITLYMKNKELRRTLNPSTASSLSTFSLSKLSFEGWDLRCLKAIAEMSTDMEFSFRLDATLDKLISSRSWTSFEKGFDEIERKVIKILKKFGIGGYLIDWRA
jgi:hypothetical protein